MYKVQYAFNLSMIMCPAVHTTTRSLLRSSSTHEPSDPLSRVKILYFSLLTRYLHINIAALKQHVYIILPRREPLNSNPYRACNYLGFFGLVYI